MNRELAARHPGVLLRQVAPIGLLEAIAEAVAVAYREAERTLEIARLTGARLVDARPHWRRSAIEEQLVRDLAGRFDGLEIHAQQNSAANCHHQLLIAGGRISLTQSLVDFRGSLPRHAEFRATYARCVELLPFAGGETDEEGDVSLYGIIAHRPSRDLAVPAFIDIIFPCRDYKMIVDRVELLPMLASNRPIVPVAAMEVVPDLASPTLRREAADGSAGRAAS